MAAHMPWTQAGRQLIDSVGIGRLALSSGALPVVIVVRCRVDNDRIVLQSTDTDLVRAARAAHVVALQVDNLAATGATDGSSVLITGVLAIDDSGTVTLTPGIASHTPVHLGPTAGRAQTDGAGSA
ncbi:pyridoxamine 5'-phosphate oxidase family protein [Calidifontibacter indicus]|uniref:Pyridoxamine 5'-phosphate oxidase-like protein n=1 Tax=Calidifontibacter indicus TaxID=419650 RepID=A0A3D9UM18_9MICO|nr:pyridoxamine 5'-phosphate oxidase family protein [Calidifontibacter indicus]REF30498.1 pyridoxamine 5'-phosphate oxidase-like protein [Calidifontibacter indicus]